MSTFHLRLLPLAGFAAALLLAGCASNQYGPPVEGKPATWGKQHYVDNQGYQQINNDRFNY
jgi:outer membrane biogenesis lipoprotein LolB